MTKQATFIVTTLGAIVGVVSNPKNIDLGENLAIRKSADMELFSLDQLTAIYNNATGETKGKFKIAKSAAVEKVMATLEKMDVSQLIKLDADQQKKVVKQAKEKVATLVDGERKVRDSKLQRMAAAFREVDGKKPKVWTVKELMEQCGTSEKITHQYISILRAPNDRFVMNIIKDKEAKTFMLQSKGDSSQQAAA
jgi:hypothetical protein